MSLNAFDHVPLTQQNPLVWSPIVNDRSSLGCTFPPSFQVDAGSGLDSQEKIMTLTFVTFFYFFIQHVFLTKTYPKLARQVYNWFTLVDKLTGRKKIICFKAISRLIQATFWLFWFWKYVVVHIHRWELPLFAIWMFLLWTLHLFNNYLSFSRHSFQSKLMLCCSFHFFTLTKHAQSVTFICSGCVAGDTKNASCSLKSISSETSSNKICML